MPKLLSKEFYSKMKKLEARYPKKIALISHCLHEAQRQHGWLKPEVLDEIAEYIDIHPAQVREVASFYTMYNLKPIGKNMIKVCTNVSCALNGGYEILSHCEKSLGIKCGETTKDNKFTLHEEECLGSCATAPVIMLNDDYVESVSTKHMDEIIGKLK